VFFTRESFVFKKEEEEEEEGNFCGRAFAPVR
jgi:hypothetical protein